MVATGKVGSFGVNWQEPLEVRQELGEGGERRLGKKNLDEHVDLSLCVQGYIRLTLVLRNSFAERCSPLQNIKLKTRNKKSQLTALNVYFYITEKLINKQIR